MKTKISIFVSTVMCITSMAWANSFADTYTQKQAAEQIVEQMFQMHAKSMNCSCNPHGQTMCCAFMSVSHCYPDTNCPK